MGLVEVYFNDENLFGLNTGGDVAKTKTENHASESRWTGALTATSSSSLKVL